METYFKGANISQSVSVNNCIYYGYTDNAPNELEVTFNDINRQWVNWNPMRGDKIKITDKAFSTGDMYVYETNQGNGFFALYAKSTPDEGYTRRIKGWDKVMLYDIVGELALLCGLSPAFYGVKNVMYTHIVQENISHYQFLQKQATLEGAGFIVHDNKAILYDIQSEQAKPPARDIALTSYDSFNFFNSNIPIYNSCEFIFSKGKGVYNSSKTAKKRLSVRGYANDVGEATRYAKNLLLNRNLNEKTGSITIKFASDLSAGSLVNIKTDDGGICDGAVFIHKIIHDLVLRKSTVFFRGV